MALWLCADCSAAYAVGLSACPNCQSTDHREDHPMPKITVHSGASNEHDPEAIDDTVTAEPTEEEPSPGSSSETSSEKVPSSPKQSGSAARSRARTTESPS